MGNCSLYYWYWGYFIYNNYDNSNGFKMKVNILQSLSLIITALTLLYLLFANLFRGTFILSDWVVVAIDLSAKVVIESIILVQKKN